MYYPYQNFIYYLLLLGFTAEKIKHTLAQWAFLFRIEDYDSVIKSLINEYPQSEQYFKYNAKDDSYSFAGPAVTTYEVWMAPLGFDVLYLKEKESVRLELEDLLYNSELKRSVQYLLLLGDKPEKIITKLALKHAVDITEECIAAFNILFWSSKLSRPQWREYSKLSVHESEMFHDLWNLSAHEIEMKLGLCYDVPIEVIIKDSIGILYTKFKNYMRSANIGDSNFNKGLRSFSEMLKGIDKIKQLSGGSDDSVSEALKKGLIDASKRTKDFKIDDNTLPLFEEFNPTE